MSIYHNTVTQIFFYMSVFHMSTFGSFSEGTKSLCTFISPAAGRKLEKNRSSILAALMHELMMEFCFPTLSKVQTQDPG